MSTCVWARDDAEVHCWGRAHPSDPEPAEVPWTFEGVADLSSLAAGAAHACFVDGGVARCWGDNADGQLGAGERGVRVSEPLAVELPEPALAVAAGGAIPIVVAAATRIPTARRDGATAARSSRAARCGASKLRNARSSSYRARASCSY
ncbi:MAG: RCC1 domain-containing protein [Sandaracinaceae bacterium]|nr:RCC1 domain-containing protein [Sandaracinaceae bacterium]